MLIKGVECEAEIWPGDNSNKALQELVDRPGDMVAICGRKGCGKSYLTALLTRAALTLPDPPRAVVCFDPRDQIDFGYAIPSGWSSFSRDVRMFRGKDDFATAVEGVDPKCLYVLDEVDLLCSPSNIDPTLWHVCNYGRHDGAILICNFRRPKRINQDVLALADYLCMFRTTGPRDRACLSDYEEELDGLLPRLSKEDHEYLVLEI